MTRTTLPAELEAEARARPLEAKAYLGFEVKKLDAKARTFEGLAATWDLDLGQDIIHRGAFKDTLAQWRRSPTAMKLLDSHNYFSIRAVVGKMLEGQETKEGLQTKWSVIEGADGDAVLDRLRAGVIESLSIGYEAIDYDFTESNGRVIRNLRKVGLKEVSLVIFPMNPAALIDLTPVKAYASTRGLGMEERQALEAARGELASLLEGGGAPPKPDFPDPPEPPQAPPEQKTEQDPPASSETAAFTRVAQLRAARLRLLASRRG